MREFCALREKTYAYLLDDDNDKDNEIRKTKGTNKCVIKCRLMFENYKDPLFNSKIIMRSQMRFKSDHLDVHSEEINKIAKL